MSAIRLICLSALAAALATTTACTGHIKGSPPDGVGATSGGNAVNGRELFQANACATCHGVTPEDNAKAGPNLLGVVGRQAGTRQSLLSSANMKKYGVIWSAATLDEFLANPSAKVPGTAMVGMLADPQQRADVIAYLHTLKE